MRLIVLYELIELLEKQICLNTVQSFLFIALLYCQFVLCQNSNFILSKYTTINDFFLKKKINKLNPKKSLPFHS
jgi:hypothetical protein